MTNLLHSEHHGRILRLVLNRHEKRNALNAAMCHDLLDAIDRANRDPQIGVIVLAAAGNCFSAGMDLSEVEDARPEQIGVLHEQLFTLAARISTPLIGEINGPALGGGMGLVANCHVVIASPAARFGLTEIRLGLWPFLVFRAVSVALGERHAIELALTGRIFDAREAQQMGLVHEISEDLPARVTELAQKISLASPVAVRSGLSFVQEIRGQTWERSALIAHRVRDEVFRSGDFLEGVRAFREKRHPKWPSLAKENDYPGEKAL